MKKHEFRTFANEHGTDGELNKNHIEGVLRYVEKWTKGMGDENDTGEMTLWFDDGFIQIEAIRSNEQDILLLDSCEEI